MVFCYGTLIEAECLPIDHIITKVSKCLTDQAIYLVGWSRTSLSNESKIEGLFFYDWVIFNVYLCTTSMVCRISC